MDDAGQSRIDRRLEIAATVLLATAAVATAWAAYQSARWHSEQAKGQSASIAARVESTRTANVARQTQIDVALFAASLFFAGISTRLRSPTSTMVVLGLGYAFFSPAWSGSQRSRSACPCRDPDIADRQASSWSRAAPAVDEPATTRSRPAR